jgi:ABC-type polysaccharide/polyol phosphate export permease
MPVPIPASVADLAMTVPTLFAAALGIWFAGTTAILLSETRLTRRITKFRLFSAWPATPTVYARAVRPNRSSIP